MILFIFFPFYLNVSRPDQRYMLFTDDIVLSAGEGGIASEVAIEGVVIPRVKRFR